MSETAPHDLDDEPLLAQCRVDTFRAGGPGGQHQNRTESGIRLTHLPSGIVVIARESRSQHRNRMSALERLRERLRERDNPPPPRVATGVPRRERTARLAEKRRASEKKRLRKPPTRDEA